MDWTTIITAIVSALAGGGGLIGVFYYNENKKAKQLANETTASTQWRELYEKAERKLDDKDLKIDALYKENKYLRDDNNNLSSQNVALKLYKCSTINCISRQPPFGTKQQNNGEIL